MNRSAVTIEQLLYEIRKVPLYSQSAYSEPGTTQAMRTIMRGQSNRSFLLASLLLLIAPTASPLRAIGGVDEYNVPEEIDTCLKNSPGLAINGEMNPFYLTGDFDGDGKLDFAVQVVRGESKGILVCLSSRKTPLIVGAGSSLIWPSAQKWRFDAWTIIPKERTDVSRPPKAKHDAILLDVKEAASGLLYWDGAALRWEQLTD